MCVCMCAHVTRELGDAMFDCNSVKTMRKLIVVGMFLCSLDIVGGCVKISTRERMTACREPAPTSEQTMV